MFHQTLNGGLSLVNGKEQIVHSGNYCYSSIKVVSIKGKKQLLKDYSDSNFLEIQCINIALYIGVMVIIVGNGHDDLRSNPGQD